MLLSNLQKNQSEIQEALISLWCEVFNDERDYAKLILPFLSEFDCFAQMQGSKIVSALYLLPCEINVNGRTYKGKYLYAAATKKEYRGNGYMGKLVNEALSHAQNHADYISLVPASESLYDYYGKFGFCPTMYRYRITSPAKYGKKKNRKLIKLDNLINFENIRRKLCSQSYVESSLKYAYRCYADSQNSFYRLNDTCCFIYNKEEKSVVEFLSSSENIADDYNAMAELFDEDMTVYSPYKLSAESVKEKCGMTVMFNEEIKHLKDIYMNLTLA